jgi:hypothetical protein
MLFLTTFLILVDAEKSSLGVDIEKRRMEREMRKDEVRDLASVCFFENFCLFLTETLSQVTYFFLRKIRFYCYALFQVFTSF